MWWCIGGSSEGHGSQGNLEWQGADWVDVGRTRLPFGGERRGVGFDRAGNGRRGVACGRLVKQQLVNALRGGLKLHPAQAMQAELVAVDFGTQAPRVWRKNGDAVAYDRPAVLVEGEIDAITIAQACGTEVAAVATGSTAGARRAEWIARLAQASVVLLAFDVDENGAGEQAAAWWSERLPRGRRLRPLDHDVNSLPEIETVRGWLTRALARD